MVISSQSTYDVQFVMIRVILISVLVGALSVFAQNSSVTSGDEFLDQNERECFTSRKLVSCIKYKVAKILWKLATNSLGYFPAEDSRTMSMDFQRIRVIHLAQPSDMQLFTDSRNFKVDNEVTRILNFFVRTVELFARNHGLQIAVSSDTGAWITDDDITVVEPRSRGDKKKTKWLIILPLIILMKIAHLKMTVVPLLLGIIGLNVLLVAGGGWLIHYLKYKTLCKIHPHFIQSHSHVYDSDPSDYSSFVGGNFPGGGHSGGGYYASHDPGTYTKDWSTSKAYNTYRGYRT